MDADVGMGELDLIYMKGTKAHSGFPEVSEKRSLKRNIRTLQQCTTLHNLKTYIYMSLYVTGVVR